MSWKIWQEDSWELCAAHQCILIPFLILYNTVDMRPLTSSQRRARLTGVSMDHFGTACYCCHYLTASSKIHSLAVGVPSHKMRSHLWAVYGQSNISLSFSFKINLFIYFWLHWVFIAACGLSLVVVCGVFSSLRCMGFSLWWLLLLWSTGSRHTGFSSCGTWAQ